MILREECAVEQENVGLNIEKIMEEIRKEAEALRYEEPVSFEEVEVLTVSRDNARDFDLAQFEQTVNRMNSVWEIPYAREIAGNPLKKLAARLARKMNKPTGLPITQDITNFNAETVRALNELLHFVREARTREEEQNRRIFELETELRKLRKGAEKKA